MSQKFCRHVCLLLLMVGSFLSIVTGKDFEDFGAISGDDSWIAASINAKAFSTAVAYATTKANRRDRRVTIAANKSYTIAPVNITEVHDFTLEVNGELKFSDRIEKLSNLKGRGMLHFIDSSELYLTGSGEIDGQGMKWWRMAYTGKDERPNLVQFNRCRDITVNYIKLVSSPKFGLNLVDCAAVRIHDIEIFVNSTVNRVVNESPETLRPHSLRTLSHTEDELLFANIDFPAYEDDLQYEDAYDAPEHYSGITDDGESNEENIGDELLNALAADDEYPEDWLNGDSAVYPLNTDGIDIAATDVEIYNNRILCYDDAIVAKPCRSDWKYCKCSGNINAYNNSITYSTGLTIGSVPPNPDVNCIRNVTFRDSTLHQPLKGIYIKPNPGVRGTGIIEDILYDNIKMTGALWWTIWIGPQQQNQPGRNNVATGCSFLFPFVPECPTQPRVSMNRITLKNIHAKDSLTMFRRPGVILCDPDNPCRNMNFENINIEPFNGDPQTIIDQLPFPYPSQLPPPSGPVSPEEWQFLVTNAYGSAVEDTVFPVPCLNDPYCFWSDHKEVQTQFEQ